MIKINIHLDDVPLDEVLNRVEAQVYKYALEHKGLNQSEAARVLGVSRGTLRTKLKQYFPGKYIAL